LIKASLALHHKVLPPTINVTRPSPALEIEKSHFYLNTEARPWFTRGNGSTRKAAVSAFGFGGTNFHLVLEEYTGKARSFQRLHRAASSFLFSAPSTEELLERLRGALAELAGTDPAGIAASLAFGAESELPPRDHPRVGFTAENPAEVRQYLELAAAQIEKGPDSPGWDHPRGIVFRAEGIGPDEKIVALFPGQGSQYLNMARELAINFPPLLEAFQEMDALFQAAEQRKLTSVLYPIPVFSEEELAAQQLDLQETDYAQAAIGVVSFGLYKILQEAGFQPDLTAGHSFGELSALWAGGALTDQAFLRLVKARGQAMRPPADRNGDSGTMAAVNGPLSEIEKLIQALEGVVIANQNSPTQVVIAGPREAIKQADQLLTEAGYKVTQLPVSAAFHTPLVKHASEPFAEAVSQEDFQKSRVPVYSNTTGGKYPADIEATRQILSDHILHPVIFKTQIEEIYQDGGRVFVEIGPRQILGSLVKDILDGKPHTVVSLNPSRDSSSDRQFRQAALTLQVIGLPLRHLDPYQQQ
jgi:acyl transferase domain-containing protein